jgi:hypothetical protein
MAGRKKIACVVTTYYTNSHADVIVGKFIRGFPTEEGLLAPEVDIVSLYMDQLSAKDVGVALLRRHGIRLCSTINEALCLDTGALAVDGVLSIGEHGSYAHNELGQHMYPRRHFLDQICAVIAGSGRSIPVFSDKHISFSWDDAIHIYDRITSLQIPFMAGSSVPLMWRDPWYEPAVGEPLDTALVLNYGDLEAYGYHGLELLMSLAERRPGGETGIASVQCLEGAAVWAAAADGRWPRDLAEACLKIVTTVGDGSSRGNAGVAARLAETPATQQRRAAVASGGELEDSFGEEPAVFLLEFVDGFKAALLHSSSGGRVAGWAYAARHSADGRIHATKVSSHREPFPHFSYMSLNVQRMMTTGVPQYPVERTLLATGAIDAVMRSRGAGHSVVETPWLAEVQYAPPAAAPIRPTGPTPVGGSIVPFEVETPTEYELVPKL